MTPPSTDDIAAAAKKAHLGDDGVEWVSTQFVMFLELSRQRGRGQSHQPLTFQDIEAYARLHDFQFNLVELSNILLLDQVFMAFCAELVEEQLALAKQKSGA